MKLLALLVTVALLSLGLIACGDDGDSGAEAGETSQPSQKASAPEKAGQGQAQGDAERNEGAGGKASDEVDLRTRPDSIPAARVTETGAVQTTAPSAKARRTAQANTYGSIRSFGAETEGEEATAITFALVQYLDAKARGDWQTACARLYSVLRESIEGEDKSCPETYGKLLGRAPRATREEQARIDVSSVRRGEGNRAFVIYKTPDTLSADMPLYVEDGVWKVGAIAAYVLEPGQAR